MQNEFSVQLTGTDTLNIRCENSKLAAELSEMLLPLCLAEFRDTAVCYLEVVVSSYIPPSENARSVTIGYGKSLTPIRGVWEMRSGNIWVTNTETRTHIIFNPARNWIRVCGTYAQYPREHIPYSTLTMNARALIVEMLAIQNERRGYPFLHASSVQMVGREHAVMFVGHKGAGKTTLLSALVAQGGKIISADRAFLYYTANRPMVRGAPDSFRVSEHTLQIVRTMGEIFPRSFSDKNVIFHERKYHIPLVYLQKKLSVQLQDGALLSHIVILEQDGLSQRVDKNIAATE